MFGQVFDQIFGQELDHIFGKCFAQGLGEGENINTVYSTSQTQGKTMKKLQKTPTQLKTATPLSPLNRFETLFERA